MSYVKRGSQKQQSDKSVHFNKKKSVPPINFETSQKEFLKYNSSDGKQIDF